MEQLYEQYKMADEDSRKMIELNIEKQKLGIQSAEEELADLKDDQGDGRIVAPISGKITALNVKAGDNVNANAVVAEISDYSELQITVPIDELDITQVEVGQTASILVEAFPNETFAGKVTSIADQGAYNNGVATFDVTVKIDEPGAIKAGMSAEASIQVASRENVLLLPVDAVRSAGGRYFVIKADADAAAAQTGQAQGRRPANQQAGSTASPESAEAGNAPARRETAGQQGGQGAQGQPTAQNPQGAQPPQGRQRNTQGNAGPQANGRVFIEVGISNEDFIEIVSGLSEGDVVVLPTAITSASNAQTGFPGGGGGFTVNRFPGGGFPGGNPGGGFTGGARAGNPGGGR